jgi:hypothetical protein
MEPEVVSLRVAETPEAWTAAGFVVDGDGRCRIGGATVELVGPGAGEAVVGWSLRGLPEGAPGDLDGFATTRADDPPGDGAGAAAEPEHPNGVTGIDHIVLLTDDLGRTVEAAEGVGLTLRRIRETATVRQAFFVVRPMVLELAEAPGDGVRSFGIALVCPDLGGAREALGDLLGPDKEAVQPGRRIATIRHRDLGMRTPLALMTPRPARF